MYNLIQQVIRFVAVLSLVQFISMMIGWSKYSHPALLLDFLAIIIWAWSEYDLRKLNKK
ncbi:MAG: hypothetical protein ACRCZ6_00120 [Kluyvera sp.]|uniref:hypothetical protein n=1 Tax=Kluyvera sp. TaxID=1538228 RepID=UPI003F3B4E09